MYKLIKGASNLISWSYEKQKHILCLYLTKSLTTLSSFLPHGIKGILSRLLKIISHKPYNSQILKTLDMLFVICKAYSVISL